MYTPNLSLCICFQRKNKYTDARFKALKAKNEYILCMDAANAAVQKYFVDDLSDLIDVSSGFIVNILIVIHIVIHNVKFLKN